MSITSRINEMSSHIEQAYDELQGLGADLTNVNKNIENISMVLDDIYDSMPQVSGEGTSLTLDDTRVGKIKSTLKGNTSQTTYSGKNLFNIEGRYETGTGITYTKNDDGSYTLNGTANGNNFLRGVYHLNEQHTISYTSNVSNSNVIIRTRTGTPTAQTGIQDQLAVSSTSGNLTSSKQFDFVEISIVNGTTLNNFKIYIQLEKGSSVTSFEPYVGGTASPNPSYPQPINVVSGDNEINVVGKNLLVPDTTTTRTSNGITSVINEDGSLTLTGTATANAYLKFTSDMTLESNTTYTTLNQNSILPNNVTMYYNSVGNIGSTYADTVISPGGRLKTYTTGEVNGTISIAILVQTGVTINTTLYPMLLKGTYTTSNIPTYEPYQGNTYNIDLPVENLLNLTNGTYTNNQGITATIENGKITLNGTGTTNPSGVTIPLTKTIIIPSNVAYNLSAFNGSTNSNVSLRLQAVESSNPYTNVTLSNINANATIQANEQYEVDRLYIRCNQGTTLSNFIIQPQIEKGSKVNSFTPYGTTPIELCKIGNYQDYFGKSNGRNLFDKDSISNGFLDESGIVGGDTSAYRTSDFIPILPNTAYYKTTTSSPRTKYYDKNKQPLNTTTYWDIPIGGNAGTFTTPSNAYYFRFSYPVTGVNVNSIMINKGTTALPYEPYGVGKWYLHKEIGKVVLNGSEDYNYESSNHRFSHVIQGSKTTASRNMVYSNYFKYLSSGAEDGAIFNYSSVVYIYNYACTSIAEFKTWLSTHNTIVYYVLATPTTEEIIDTTLISQLDALESAMSYKGQTNISQVNNDLPFIISASALKEWQENTSLNSTLSMGNPLSLGNTLNTQENNTQPIEVDNIEPLEEEENEES